MLKCLNEIPLKFRISGDISLTTSASSRKVFTDPKRLWRRLVFSQFSPLSVYGDFDGQIQSPLSKKRLIQIFDNF